jgi:DNA-binding CsgD family transcriptional regulator
MEAGFVNQKTRGGSVTAIFAVFLTANGESPRLSNNFKATICPDANFFATALQEWFQKGNMFAGEAFLPGFSTSLTVTKETRDHDLDLIEPLTGREIEVLQLLSEGLSNKEIAQRLFISQATVKFHNNCIYTKMGVHGRVQAAISGKTLGLLE